LKVEDKHGGSTKSLTEVRADIEKKLVQEEAQQIQDRWIASLRRKPTSRRINAFRPSLFLFLFLFPLSLHLLCWSNPVRCRVNKFDYDHEHEQEQDEAAPLASHLAIAPGSDRRLSSSL